jgi:predicted dienelactone hydrolase
MGYNRAVRALVALLLAVAFVLPPVRAQQARDRRHDVGAETRRFTPREPYDWRGAATEALVTTIWFPAAAASVATEHHLGPPGAPWFQLGAWAQDAAPMHEPFPLVLLSHGTGGSAQIMSWLATGLVARGYIVAAVNHPGNNALERYTAEGFLLWWLRARDLSATLDALLGDPTFAPLIDPRRIGAIGFSLGGYTVLTLAGARTDPARFQRFCQSPAAEGCDPPESPNLMARWAELARTNPAFRDAQREAGRSYRDPRVRAVFALAPALGPAFIPDSLRQIGIPIEIMAGADDRMAPVTTNARPIAAAIPRATLRLLPAVGHYAFLAPCTREGHVAQPQLCEDAASTDRAAIHQRVVDSAAGFFNRTLR